VLTDVLAIKISHEVGRLQVLLEAICKAHINIEYMYAVSTGKAEASIVIKTSDLVKAQETLEAMGVEIISEEEIAKM
jgi:hypothetical protein